MTKTIKAKQISKTLETKLESLPTKSARIRYLDSEAFTRSEIAKILNIRYQHVRNVLITPLKKK